MRTAPGCPVRPNGDVMRTERSGTCARTDDRRLAPTATAATRSKSGRRADVLILCVRRGRLPIVDEITRTGCLQQVEREVRRPIEVLRQRDCLVDKVAGVTSA